MYMVIVTEIKSFYRLLMRGIYQIVKSSRQEKADYTIYNIAKLDCPTTKI